MRSLKTIILALLVLLCVAPVRAQNDSTEKKSPDLTFVVKKLSDGSFELKSRLSLFENRVDFPISGAQVDFALGTDSLIKIEGNKTDKNGYALAYIKPGVRIPRDKEGVITANASFAGSNLYEAASAEAAFTEARIKATCEMADTVRTVKVEAYKINADGSESPIAGESVTVSVQRMFSRLPLGEVTLDEEGKGSLEFPSDLPGDSLGNLQVIAFMAEHEVFGNVESATQVKWGIPKQKVLVTHRALWTQIAPLWMIVSLSILLIGVWAHYIYVIAQLIFVKIKGNKTVVE